MKYEDFVRRLLFLFFLEKHEEGLMADIKLEKLTPEETGYSRFQLNPDFPRLELLDDMETNLVCVSVHAYKRIFEYLGCPMETLLATDCWRNDSAYFLDILDMQVKYLHDSDRVQNYAQEENYIIKNVPQRSDDFIKNRFKGSIDTSNEAIQAVQFSELSDLNFKEIQKKVLKPNIDVTDRTLKVDQALHNACAIFNIYPDCFKLGIDILLKQWRNGQVDYSATNRKYRLPDEQERCLLRFFRGKHPEGYYGGTSEYDSSLSIFDEIDLIGTSFSLQSKGMLSVKEIKVQSNTKLKFIVDVNTTKFPESEKTEDKKSQKTVKKCPIKTIRLDEISRCLIVNEDVAIKYSKNTETEEPKKKFKILKLLWDLRAEKVNKELIQGKAGDTIPIKELKLRSGCESLSAVEKQVNELKSGFRRKGLDIEIPKTGENYKLVVNKVK